MAKVRCVNCKKEVDLSECKPINLQYSDNPGANGKVGALTYNYICKKCQDKDDEK